MPIRLPSRYLVGREIGRGGMGIDWRAEFVTIAAAYGRERVRLAACC